MSGCLHLLFSDESRAWGDCLACRAPDEPVVLMGEAVSVLRQSQFLDVATDVPLFAISADAAARGLNSEQVRLIDDADLVGLVERHPHVLSWT